ncbi:hypothetical protein L3X38_016729 [Prunus dulcis]|uniref:RNase H type-1 domain-containing protein n=1 Tax=Prunus dulcis TaxID=3755 RepID=A0AAD4W5X5_PRUDU|nr:hypothetical protein L3X38_016729 [Prunus dulcis]
MNQALLAKIGWRLHIKDEGLWAKIYEAKYLKGHSILDDSVIFRQDCSSTWRGVLHGAALLRNGMLWRIGDGGTVKFGRAKKVWNALLNSSQSAGFFTLDFQPWLRVNLMSKIVWADGIPWNLVFVFTCWYIWKWRNYYVFHGDEELAFDSIQIITAAAKELFKASNVSSIKCAKVEAWFAKLLLAILVLQILEAELWGLLFGLRMAIAKGFNNLIVEMDSPIAIQLVQHHDSLTLHPLASLVSSCWQLMQQLENCSLHHIFREKNSVADRLAAWSYNLDLASSLSMAKLLAIAATALLVILLLELGLAYSSSEPLEPLRIKGRKRRRRRKENLSNRIFSWKNLLPQQHYKIDV